MSEADADRAGFGGAVAGGAFLGAAAGTFAGGFGAVPGAAAGAVAGGFGYLIGMAIRGLLKDDDGYNP